MVLMVYGAHARKFKVSCWMLLVLVLLASIFPSLIAVLHKEGFLSHGFLV